MPATLVLGNKQMEHGTLRLDNKAKMTPFKFKESNCLKGISTIEEDIQQTLWIQAWGCTHRHTAHIKNIHHTPKERFLTLTNPTTMKSNSM